MFTQCPHCYTLFRIQSEQLRAAHGRVRCSQCSKVFNALESFAERREETEDWPESRFVRKIDYNDDILFTDRNTIVDELDQGSSSASDLLEELASLYQDETPPPPHVESMDQRESGSGEVASDDQGSGETFGYSAYFAELERQSADKKTTENSTPVPSDEIKEELLDTLDIDEDAHLELPRIDPGIIPPPPSFSQDDDEPTEEVEHLSAFTTDQEESLEPVDTLSAETGNFILDGIDSEAISTSETEPFLSETGIDKDQQDGTPRTEDEETGEDESSNRYSTPTEDDDPLPFRLTDNLPEIEPSADQAISLEEEVAEKRGRSKRHLLLALLILTLLIAASLQIIWLAREQLIKHPVTARYLNQMCARIDCKLPVRSEPEKFQVIDRSLLIAPETPDILQLTLIFSNTANFPQPYPELRLSLFGSDESLLARRSFKPTEYLGHPVDDEARISPREQINIHMSLEEPGDDVTGFRFEFQ